MESCSKTFFPGNTHRQKNPPLVIIIVVNSMQAGEQDGRELLLEQGSALASRQAKQTPGSTGLKRLSRRVSMPWL